MEAKLSILAATIAATLLATVVQADEAAIKAVTKCAEDNKIQMESLMKSCDPATDLSTVPGFKCFTKCAQQFMGVMDDAGKFDPAKSAGFVAEEDRAAAKELAEACGAEANAIADLCDRAFAANACMAKKSPEMYKKSCMAIMNKMMSAS